MFAAFVVVIRQAVVVTLSMAVGWFDIYAIFVIIGRVDDFTSFTVTAIGWSS